jgi:hypothetical protein
MVNTERADISFVMAMQLKRLLLCNKEIKVVMTDLAFGGFNYDLSTQTPTT